MKKIKLTLLTLLLISFAYTGLAQDTVFHWTVSSKKISSNQYEILFSTPGNPNWQLYAPNQSFSDVPTTEIQFDSAIQFNNHFETTGKNKTAQNAIFGVPVNYNEGAVTWKAIITIPGKVPAVIQDTLLYTYGRGEEFYGGTQFAFSVELEGGIKNNSSLKVASINVRNP